MKKHGISLLILFLISCNGKSVEESTLKGRLTIGHEVSVFRPCGDTLSYWIIDKSLKLDSLYSQITNNQPFQEVYCEIKANKTLPVEGFSLDYDGVLSVKEIIKIERFISQEHCK